MQPQVSRICNDFGVGWVGTDIWLTAPIQLRYIDTVFLGRQNHDNQINAKFEKKSCLLY